MQEPIIEVGWGGKRERYDKYKYAAVFLPMSLSSSGPYSGSWYLIPYVNKGKDQPHLQFTNCGPQPVYVGISGTGIVADIASPKIRPVREVFRRVRRMRSCSACSTSLTCRHLAIRTRHLRR